MEKYTLSEFRKMLRTGTAKELTAANVLEYYEKIGYSAGVYGINGGLIQDKKTGDFYIIIGRYSLLFKIF